MSKFINVEDLNNHKLVNANKLMPPNAISTGWNACIKYIQREVPEADVRENEYGEWILVCEDNRVKRRCSRCGWEQIYDEPKYQGYRYNFCPNCSAIMKGSEPDVRG